MPRESAEDKITRLIQEAISANNRRTAEEKDPNKQWFRQAIREELQDMFGPLLKGGGAGRGGKRGSDDESDEESERGIFGIFG